VSIRLSPDGRFTDMVNLRFAMQGPVRLATIPDYSPPGNRFDLRRENKSY
jgi:hypothetical protein